MRCSTHDQSKEKDLWLRPQHLLDMTSKSAYTVVATGIHTASTTNFRCYPGGGGHPLYFGLPSSARRGGGTVPGQWQVVAPCLLSRQTTSMTVKQRMDSFHLWGRHLFLFGLRLCVLPKVCPIAGSCNQQYSD